MTRVVNLFPNNTLNTTCQTYVKLRRKGKTKDESSKILKYYASK